MILLEEVIDIVNKCEHLYECVSVYNYIHIFSVPFM